MRPFFSYDQVRNWRGLATIEGWEVNKPFSTEARALFSPASPSVRARGGEPHFRYHNRLRAVRIEEATYGSRTLKKKEGFILATDSRLILAGMNRGILEQVPYTSIQNVFVRGSDFQLGLADGSEVTIKTKVPRTSFLGAIVMLAGDPEEKVMAQHREGLKEDLAGDFLSAFTGFFNQIVDSEPDAKADWAIAALARWQSIEECNPAASSPRRVRVPHRNGLGACPFDFETSHFDSASACLTSGGI